MAKRNNRFQFQTMAREEESESSYSKADPVQNSNQNQRYSENPSLILLNTLLTRKSYLPWSKDIRRALVAKDKLQYMKKILS